MTAQPRPPDAARRDVTPAERRRTIVEVLVAFLVATTAVALLNQVGRAVPLVRDNMHALVALIFLVLPQQLLRRRGNIERYGFTLQPLRLGLVIAGVAIVLLLPPFAVGFVALLRLLCAHAPQWVPGACWKVAHPVWRAPPQLWLLAPAQLLVTALPEELFFRGYVQGRLEEVLPPRHSLLGAKVGVAWLLQAFLFGIGHFALALEPQMATRFFPGLVFGWMYARTRSILPGVIFHAACNLLMQTLVVSLLT